MLSFPLLISVSLVWGLGLVTRYLLNDFLNEGCTNVLVRAKKRENEQAGSSEQDGFKQQSQHVGTWDSPRDLVKMQILTQQVWGATWESSFPIVLLMMWIIWILLVPGPHSELWGPRWSLAPPSPKRASFHPRTPFLWPCAPPKALHTASAPQPVVSIWFWPMRSLLGDLRARKEHGGTSLVIQWLHAPNGGGRGSIPGEGTEILHASNEKIPHAATKISVAQ